jgi:dipeptidyl aminopeptidase/acylaminoacyl peptidase
MGLSGVFKHYLSIVTLSLAASLPFHSLFPQTLTIAHWELQTPVLDADISPDDRLLAITTQSPDRPKSGETLEKSIAVWDYHENKQIARAVLGTYSGTLWAESDPVRFTYDGALLVVADGQSIDVFDAARLKLLRRIDVPLSGTFRIHIIETSPLSRVALVAADNNGLGGEFFAYDLDDGRELLRRKDMTRITSIAWQPDGTEFALAMPLPCSSAGDIEVDTVGSWAQVAKLHGRNLESVAFANDKLYAVQTSFCKGSVFNRHLAMQVFDFNGKHTKTVLLANKDIHDSVSYSSGKVLADTGTVRTQFDALDMTTASAAVAAQITVWNRDARSLIYTSEPINIHAGSHFSYAILRLSRTGKMAIMVDRYVHLFQLP